MRLGILTLGVTALMLVAGCGNNPATNKSQAVTREAAPQTSPQAFLIGRVVGCRPAPLLVCLALPLRFQREFDLHLNGSQGIRIIIVLPPPFSERSA